jgi:hypothetical protein
VRDCAQVSESSCKWNAPDWSSQTAAAAAEGQSLYKMIEVRRPRRSSRADGSDAGSAAAAGARKPLAAAELIAMRLLLLLVVVVLAQPTAYAAIDATGDMVVSPPAPVLLPCLTGWLPSCDSPAARFVNINATEVNAGWVQQPDGHGLLLMARPSPLARGPTGIWTSVLSSGSCSATDTRRSKDGALECAWTNPCQPNDAQCLPSVLLAFLNGTSGFGAPTYTVSPSGTLFAVSSAYPTATGQGAVGVVSAQWDAATGRFRWPTGVVSKWGNVITPRVVWRGRDAGGVFNVIVTSTGRLVTGFEMDRAKDGSLSGSNVTLAYANDKAAPWQLTNAIATPTPNPRCFAGEPTVTQLSDGSLLVMIRNEGGLLWHSTSTQTGNGLRLRPPTRSRLMSSDSPSYLLRLRHDAWSTRSRASTGQGPLLILWANAGTTWPLACNAGNDVPCVYTIRSVLHAALSFDDGKSWHGHREVYRDPCARGDCFRNHRDYGVAYSSAFEQLDGTVLVKTGQGVGHWGSFVLDPWWLLETTQQADFSSAAAHACHRDTKCYNGSFVSTCMLFDQICASETPALERLAPNCSDPGADGVGLGAVSDGETDTALCLSSNSSTGGGALVWNFPSASAGTLNLTLQPTAPLATARIALTDYYAPPYDADADALTDICSVRSNCSCGRRCAPMFATNVSFPSLRTFQQVPSESESMRESKASQAEHYELGSHASAWLDVAISWDLRLGEASYTITPAERLQQKFIKSNAISTTRLKLIKTENEGAVSYLRVRGAGVCVRALSSQTRVGGNN